MNARKVGRLGVGFEFDFPYESGQLLVNVLPLAHPKPRDKMLAAPAPKLVLRYVSSLLVKERPKVEVGHEI